MKRSGRPPKAAAPAESVEGRILDSASRLFYTEGLGATGIERVLAGAGAAKASLYAHFGSKDELVTAYLERQAQTWRDQVEERVAPGDGRDGLLRFFDLVGELIGSAGFRGCPFLNAAGELPDPSHPARDAMRRQREWLHGLIRGLLTSAGVQDLDRMTHAAVILHDGAMAAAVLDEDPEAVAAARFAVERLLDCAVSPAPGPTSPRRKGSA